MQPCFFTICFIAEFKTPTRPARGQFRRLIADDSPSNDPDFHQDIIWDTTSPSPVRHGNDGYVHLLKHAVSKHDRSVFISGRGQRRAANVRAVDISDLANRIAPKVCSRSMSLPQCLCFQFNMSLVFYHFFVYRTED